MEIKEAYGDDYERIKDFIDHQTGWCKITQESTPGMCGQTAGSYVINANSYNKENYMGWHIDKDIICPNCKLYSPDTCVFVPSQINTLTLKSKTIRGKMPIGVSKFKTYYLAIMKIRGKTKHLGCFKSPEEAFNCYKMSKEAHIKEVAEEWKDKIDPRVYQALINYEVKITD